VTHFVTHSTEPSRRASLEMIRSGEAAREIAEALGVDIDTEYHDGGEVMYQVSQKAVAVCCPLCGARTIGIAQESVIADSYYCANCRAYFAVTAAFPPPSYILTTTTAPVAERSTP